MASQPNVTRAPLLTLCMQVSASSFLVFLFFVFCFLFLAEGGVLLSSLHCLGAGIEPGVTNSLVSASLCARTLGIMPPHLTHVIYLSGSELA